MAPVSHHHVVLGGMGMRRILIAVMLLATAAPALAQGPRSYDWPSRRYTVRPAIGGGAYVLGYDPFTTSHWMTDVDPRGNMYGFDPYGNYWTYQRGSNTYTNFGTGRVCSGLG